MTKKAKDLDPMNNVRKAAKDGDWMSLMVEYAANKAGLGALVGQQSPNTAEKEGVTSPKTAKNTDYLVDYLNK
jgi:ribosomal protein L7Ae-like RNA K-turn-binding protein